MEGMRASLRKGLGVLSDLEAASGTKEDEEISVPAQEEKNNTVSKRKRNRIRMKKAETMRKYSKRSFKKKAPRKTCT